MIKKFLKSFKPRKEHGIVVAFDAVFYAIMIPCILLYIIILNKKASILSLITQLETESVEQMQPAMASLQSFFLFLVWGIVILGVIVLFAYSLSRTLLWNYLLKKEFDWKKYLKFNLLNLMLFAAAGVILAVCILLLWVNPIIAVILIFLASTIIIFFMMLVKIEYTQNGKIFAAIGHAFSRISSRTALAWLLYLPVFAIIGFIIDKIAALPSKITAWFIFLILFLIFLAWMRLYILSTISKK